jgi:hypothetical protein
MDRWMRADCVCRIGLHLWYSVNAWSPLEIIETQAAGSTAVRLLAHILAIRACHCALKF